MRITGVVAFGATLCGIALAQSERPEADWADISQKLTALQAAVQTRDLNKTNDLVDEFRRLVFTLWRKQQPTEAEYLEKAEQRIAVSPLSRTLQLPYLAELAFRAGELEKAERYARETLQNPRPKGLDDSIHVGNIVLGLLALKRDDVVAAIA
jgi:hypothetical protein